ncbi:hypothetical protein QYE76_054574 [Lolium multiflorum]|uniref:Transposase (putative) gypsy type domain-containing protein n=1 Tax=Lolium multiflorum TaxID=4521 RepID=A0AAD8WNM3_LOLMU|nr:hypothetical protein QYE76_054574 [Lolium multiflorum]
MVALRNYDVELRELQNEGMISAHWSFIRDTVVPKPGAGEVVMTKAWVERIIAPLFEFFLSILNTYGLQPHNICPNSYLLLSNFATLCEGHLGIRPDVKLWQFFFRVKKETKDKAMLNCGSMTFMLRPGRMYPPHDSHESVRYWNAGWFYEKNASVPEIHDGLPKFNNEPPEELASWSFVPSLAQTPILEKAARRISWLVHDGLTGTQLTLSWFTRRIQPLRYNARLICAYTGADDQLRATRHDLPADSLKRRFKTLVKIGRGQPIPELIKDIYTNNHSILWRRKTFAPYFVVPVSSDAAEEVPDDEEEEEEQAPRNAAPRPLKRPRAKASGSEAGASGEASAKKPKTIKPPPLDSRKAERERLKMLASRQTPRPIIPGAPEKVGGEDPKAKGPAREETEVQGQGEAEVTSSEKVGAGAGDVVVFPKNFGDPADLTSTPKAYATKFFNKLTEAEKWELEQDLLNAMLNNAWGKPDAATSEIQDFKKDVGQFFDKLICKQKRLQGSDLDGTFKIFDFVTASNAMDRAVDSNFSTDEEFSSTYSANKARKLAKIFSNTSFESSADSFISSDSDSVDSFNFIDKSAAIGKVFTTLYDGVTSPDKNQCTKYHQIYVVEGAGTSDPQTSEAFDELGNPYVDPADLRHGLGTKYPGSTTRARVQLPQSAWDRAAKAMDGSEPMTNTATAQNFKHINIDLLE